MPSKPSESRRLAARLREARTYVMRSLCGCSDCAAAIRALERAAMAVGRYRGSKRGRR
jgi:hypothetical protein